jgi:hypothetical protein
MADSWVAYERKKAEWVRQNPTATQEQYDRAMRQILKELKL